MPESLQAWATRELGRLLGFTEGAEDIANYLLAFSPAQRGDMEAYAGELLGDGEPVRQFCSQLFRKLQQRDGGGGGASAPASAPAASAPDPVPDPSAPVNSKLTGIAGLARPASKLSQKERKRQQRQQQEQEQARQHGGVAVQAPDGAYMKPREEADYFATATPAPAAAPAAAPSARVVKPPAAPQETPQEQEEPRNELEDGMTLAELRATFSCKCYATEHALLTNCTSCGKIICEFESHVRCSFCGDTLATANVSNRKRKGLEARRSQLAHAEREAAEREAAQEAEEALRKANAHKDKLLHYDRTAAQRTKVYDDQADYYGDSNSRWLSPEERATASALEAKRHESVHTRRRPVKISFDLAGRRMVEEVDNGEGLVGSDGRAVDTLEETKTQRERAEAKPAGYDARLNRGRGQKKQAEDGAFRNETLTGRAADIYRALSASLRKQGAASTASQARQRTRRVQREEDQRDEGEAPQGPLLVTLPQPHASLLLAGFKRYIDKSWATDHRGPVWVAAGPCPSEGELRAAEVAYAQMYPDEGSRPPFPAAYPSDALLGKINVMQCLSQEEYRSDVIDATSPVEARSPFLWATAGPMVLSSPAPLSAGLLRRDRLVALPQSLLTPSMRLAPTDMGWHLHTAGSEPAEAKGDEAGEEEEEGPFDLRPGDEPTPRRPRPALSVRPASRVLAPGVVLLSQALSLPVQQWLIDRVRPLGAGPGGFYRPLHVTGHPMRLRMMSLGKHWNSATGAYEAARTNHDNAVPPPIPPALLVLMREVLQQAAFADPLVLGNTTVEDLQPDVCLCNFYQERWGGLGMHQDKSESEGALRAGSPVVSFSIGATAEFAYSLTRAEDMEAVPSVQLQSGDVLVFGGPARLLSHGVKSVLPSTTPSLLKMRPGRLNMTFRQY